VSAGTDLCFETLVVTVSDGIGVITINRPESLNALNLKVLQELDTCLGRLEQLETLSALILTGQGEKAFAAGADISAMVSMSPGEAADFSGFGQAVFQRLSGFPVPVIAAVNGYALGGGNELAMACDIRIASQNAKFGQPEVGLGIIPGFGGTQWLPAIVGVPRALELILTGRVIDAAEALSIGLVHKVVPAGEALRSAEELARVIASKSGLAVRNAKKAIKRDGHAPLSLAGFALERQFFAKCFEGPDQAEGMRAFLQKRAPKFQR